MREKYIDERVGIWFIFGESPYGVDINDGNRDVFEGVTREVADQLCTAQERFQQELYSIMKGL